MKKIIVRLAAVFCCSVALLFVSCQKGGGSSTPEEQTDLTPATVELAFTFWGTQDMLDFADTKVTYNDGTGDKTETVTVTEWKKTVKAALPVSFKFERKVTLKDGFHFQDDQAYSYTIAHFVEYKILNAKGMEISSRRSGGSGLPNSLKGNKIGFIVDKGDLDASYTFDFDKDGKCPQIDTQ